VGGGAEAVHETGEHAEMLALKFKATSETTVMTVIIVAASFSALRKRHEFNTRAK
jgi:hypothetical protein